MPDTDTDGFPHFPRPDVAYADAPRLVAEICWTAEQAANRSPGQRPGREFWLRKAALLDRIALEREVTHSPEEAIVAAEVAAEAALRLIEHDEEHGNGCGRSGTGSLRLWDPIVSAGTRAYVRREYLAWRRAQHS